ncbi:MAG: UDP-glucose/GDP-mannose dehydrogenase family protein [Candidatus Moraniibacteriota bacterium]|nr:MAG: UDP-glucose/GDP-mannose dehydrogenase family protein [Candidatus Moranbacteria bacterium]
MKLTFVGAGYVGLVSGACMAEIGHTVVCADVDAKKIAKLKRGGIPIYEFGLEELVKENVRQGRLSFTTDIGKAIRESEAVFSGVGTPPDPKTGEADLQYVFAVAEAFGKNLNEYKVLVNKSTVPVGTADRVREIVMQSSDGTQEFDVVSNPEFLREGTAVKDFLNPDRVIVGTESERAWAIMERIYRPVARAGRPIIQTDVKSAEIIKYASNSFLATKISFINEIANFCAIVGGNAKEVARGMGFDTRIGSRFLSAGIGYGGSCFPKDVKALLHTGTEYGYEFTILEAVRAANEKQKLLPINFLKKSLKTLKGKRIALWGLSFKPRTDDVREAPALLIIDTLLKSGASVVAFDPVATENAKAVLKSNARLKFSKDQYSAADGADALVVATEWDEFRTADFADLQKRMRGTVIVDGRNIFRRSEAEAAGFTYFGVGV